MVETEQISSESAGVVRQVLSGTETSRENLDPRARQQEAVLAFGRRANARPNLSVLMQDAVEMVSEVLEADLGGVGLVVAEGTAPILTLTVASRGGRGEAADPLVHKSPLTAGDSMAVYALNAASPVAASNLPDEQRFTDTCLLKLGTLSALTVPLHLNQGPFGTLGVYRKQQQEFTPDEVRFAETIAYLLISSIVQTKAENELQRQRAFVTRLLEAVDTLVLELDAEGKLVDINRACRELTGFSVEEVCGKQFGNVFVVPKDMELFQGIFRNIAKNKSPSLYRRWRFESSLLTKDGTSRSMSWSLSVIRDREKTLQSIVLTGTDRTELLEVQEELKLAKAEAETASTIEELRKQVAAGDPFGSRRVATPGGKPGKEKRTSPRQSFHYEQLIAPMYGGSMPSRKDFFNVVCEDISAGGISFLFDEPPDFKSLVVALGQGPSTKYLTARVARVVEKQQDGEKAYMVGCQFSGRVYI